MGRFDDVRRGAGPVLGAGLIAALVLACGGGDRVGGAAALDASTTKAQVAELAGGPPARCVFSAPGLELCSWPVATGSDAWTALSGAEESDGELNLLCELPLDGSPRAAGSCRAHPRSA